MPDDDFEALLATLATRGIELDGFDAMAQRQAVDRRMRELGLSDLAEYRAVVAADEDEAGTLAQRVLLGYTAFLRDDVAWRALARLVVPGLVPPLRAWSAGCGTGEEPYTLAMLLTDAFGPGRPDVVVLATDVDSGALAAARRAVYPAAALRGVPRRWRRRYCRRRGDDYEVAAAVRRSVTVAHHDLVRDPPPTQLDLVVCRHTLMYFHPDAQRQILAGFAGALRPGGVLLCERTDVVEGFAWAPLGDGLYRRSGLCTSQSDSAGKAARG